MTDVREKVPPQQLTRPNGATYKARRVVAVAWENDDSDWGVIVLGTHDVAAAEPFAAEMCRYWFGAPKAYACRTGWFRDGFQYGERTWVDDDERGRAGVYFVAADDEVSS